MRSRYFTSNTFVPTLYYDCSNLKNFTYTLDGSLIAVLFNLYSKDHNSYVVFIFIHYVSVYICLVHLSVNDRKFTTLVTINVLK